MWELLFLLVFGTTLWVALTQRRRRRQGWRDAAAACGLQVVETSGFSRQLRARAGPLDVGIETYGSRGRYTRIVLRIPWPPHLRGVSIRRESLLRLGQGIEIGDQRFDSTFFVQGPVRQALALLDVETRRLMGLVNSDGRLEVSDGTLRVDHMTDDVVPYVLPLLCELGRRIAQPEGVLRRLADNANRDPEPGVRLQNLRLLLLELPEAPETLEVLRAARSDPSPEVRLQAARGLGAEGRDLLLDLAESLVEDAVSAEAVSALDRELSFERTKAILDHALDRRRPKTARACLEALVKSGDAAALEPPLLLALQSEEAELRVAAANALGRAGSVAAVLPLQEAAERFPYDKELLRAAREAVAEIQSRLHGASPGQLSLETTGAGQLSLAQAEAGQLSLAQAEAGQLSLEPFEAGPPEQPSPRAREGPIVRPA